VRLNGSTLNIPQTTEDYSAFLSSIYKKTGMQYPKFYKMDRLCKLGVIATELLTANNKEWQDQDKSRTAMLFANTAGSLESDRQHVKTISDKNNYFPSPSVFVYTLTNIVTGEIAIRHKITGENAFFLMDHFDPGLFATYTDILLQTSGTDAVVCGWVNADLNKNDAFVYWVKKSNFKEESGVLHGIHSVERISQLFNT
jgi:hypothetical protein